MSMYGQRATYFDLVQYTSKQYRPSRSPTTRTDVPPRLPGVSPTHPGHACQRASPHDAHVVTGRTHHLSSPSWSSLRRRQLCCSCSWTSWTVGAGLVRDGGRRRRYEAGLQAAMEQHGRYELKVASLPARALRNTPRLRALPSQRLRVCPTSCFSLTACFARRSRATPTIPPPASSSTARTSPF